MLAVNNSNSSDNSYKTLMLSGGIYCTLKRSLSRFVNLGTVDNKRFSGTRLLQNVILSCVSSLHVNAFQLAHNGIIKYHDKIQQFIIKHVT